MCSTGHGRNRILFIERGLAYCKTKETDLSWTSYGRNGVHMIGRGVVYRKMRLHRVLFISIVDLLQPPRATVHPPSTSSSLHFATVHPRAPVHPASTTRYSTSYCSTSPLHGVLFNHPSMGYCSSSPPPATVQPALHRLLFNQPSMGSCSSTGSIDRVLFIQRQRPLLPRVPVHPTPHQELFIQTPNNAHCSSRGSIDRLQLAAVAKESLRFS